MRSYCKSGSNPLLFPALSLRAARSSWVLALRKRADQEPTASLTGARCHPLDSFHCSCGNRVVEGSIEENPVGCVRVAEKHSCRHRKTERPRLGENANRSHSGTAVGCVPGVGRHHTRAGPNRASPGDGSGEIAVELLGQATARKERPGTTATGGEEGDRQIPPGMHTRLPMPHAR